MAIKYMYNSAPPRDFAAAPVGGVISSLIIWHPSPQQEGGPVSTPKLATLTWYDILVGKARYILACCALGIYIKGGDEYKESWRRL